MPPRRSGPDYLVDETGCWIWQHALSGNGYGSVQVNGRKQSAHVLFYERAKGPVPAGKQLDHLCRNRACVNPEHLEPVSHATNGRRGAHAKLTEEAAAEIRASSESGKELARRFGVAPCTISHVRRGFSWRTEAA